MSEDNLEEAGEREINNTLQEVSTHVDTSIIQNNSNALLAPDIAFITK